ncbi:hypothetical protein COLO4_00173 [Corchorus olitorius]|uniref:Uncharacterized protein n=1 Tax=Corchorus olitorius TaxID=93759 RepID=A0A1R3L4E8_9ROSI|nr:hypothetical protein COLO4_00173 [Corchorus olitorius]
MAAHDSSEKSIKTKLRKAESKLKTFCQATATNTI